MFLHYKVLFSRFYIKEGSMVNHSDCLVHPIYIYLYIYIYIYIYIYMCVCVWNKKYFVTLLRRRNHRFIRQNETEAHLPVGHLSKLYSKIFQLTWVFYMSDSTISQANSPFLWLLVTQSDLDLQHSLGPGPSVKVTWIEGALSNSLLLGDVNVS